VKDNGREVSHEAASAKVSVKGRLGLLQKEEEAVERTHADVHSL
jgi:hypothetical protein